MIFRSLLGDHVDTPQTGVGVTSREGHVGIGEIVAGDNMAELRAEQRGSTKSSIPVAKDTGHDKHWPVIRTSPSYPLNSDSEIYRRHGIVSDTNLSA